MQGSNYEFVRWELGDLPLLTALTACKLNQAHASLCDLSTDLFMTNLRLLN